MGAIPFVLEARGTGILDPILSRLNIDMSGAIEAPAAAMFLGYGGFVVFALLGTRCFAYAKRYEAVPAPAVFSQDSRPPVVYLRSFADDSKAANRLAVDAGLKMNTEEGEIAEIVRSIGPLVAIGRPGEDLSYYGAARIYVGTGTGRSASANYSPKPSSLSSGPARPWACPGRLGCAPSR